MAENETAIITIKAKLVADVESDVGQSETREPFFDNVDPDLQQYIDQEIQNDMTEAFDEVFREEGISTESLEKATDLIEDIDSKGLTTAKQFFSSPTDFTQDKVIQVLSRAGPHGAIAAAIITAVLASPEVVSTIVQAFAVKGGPLNQDFRFNMEEQINQQFDRRTQYKRLTFEDPVITYEHQGFITPSDPDFAGNSLVYAEVGRSARVGLDESSYGYLHGI